ncbi:MAG: methyltransferase domain-containing protein [Pseudomonadota bacterium]
MATGDGDKNKGVELLEGAYAIRTPADSVTYYASFADDYDAVFAGGLGYVYPRLVADIYQAEAGPVDRPVADIGCGTGLVAEALDLPPAEVEGFDISSEMLEKAREKGLYGALHRVDLTADDPVPGGFGAVVSAGTFTHGHLGPDALPGLLRFAREDALFVIGINAEHYAARGFDAALAALTDAGRITAPAAKSVPVYAGKDTAHATDRALVCVFRSRG